MEKQRRVEYKVVILQPGPAYAEEQLNKLAEDRWHVVGTVHEDRVILEREKA